MTFVEIPDDVGQNFRGAHHQGFRRHAYVQISIAGQNVTDKMRPYLISVKVVDRMNAGPSTCLIELDDRDAELEIPLDDEPVLVSMGWEGEGPRVPPVPTGVAAVEGRAQELAWEQSSFNLVFIGWTSSVESGFNRRGGGRRLWIEASSERQLGGAKSNAQQFAWGDGEGGVRLEQVIQDMAGAAGLSAVMPPSIGNITRSFWFANESLNHFGARIAGETGSSFSIMGDRLVFTDMLSGKNALDQDMPVIPAYWGINLIGWRIKPFVDRPQFKEASNRVFNILKGTWGAVTTAIGGSGAFGAATAVAGLPGAAPNRRVGGQRGAGLSSESRSERGVGWVMINGEPRARAGSTLIISGARPGVDGKYMITEAEHDYTRSGGYITRCTVRAPENIVVPPRARAPGAPAPGGSFPPMQTLE